MVSLKANRRDWHMMLVVGVAVVSASMMWACGNESTSDGDSGTLATPTQDTSPIADMTLPTPDALGDYRELTVEQARALATFDIVLPDDIPAGLEAPTIMLSSPPALSPESPTPAPSMATMFFDVTGSEPQNAIQFVQRAGGTGTVDTEGDTTTIEVNGRTINKSISVNASGDPIVMYWWSRDDDVHQQVVAVLRGGLTEDTVNDLVDAIAE